MLNLARIKKKYYLKLFFKNYYFSFLQLNFKNDIYYNMGACLSRDHGDYFKNAGLLLSSGNTDANLLVWNLNETISPPTNPQQIFLHSGKVYSTAQIDKNRIVSGAWDSDINIWHLDDTKTKHPVDRSQHGSIMALLKLDEDHFVGACAHHKLKVIHSKTYNLKKEIIVPPTHDIVSLAKIDNETIASAGKDKLIYIWNLENGEYFTLDGHTDCVNSVIRISSNNESLVRLASCSRDKTIKIWTLEKKIDTTTEGNYATITKTTVEQDSKNSEVKKTEEPNKKLESVVEVVKKENKQDGEQPQQQENKQEKVTNTITTQKKEETVSNAFFKYYKKGVVTFDGFTTGHNDITEVDEKTIATADIDGYVRIYDVANQKLLRTLYAHNGPALKITRINENLIASGGKDTEIQILDVIKGEKLKTLSGHKGEITSLTPLF